MATPDGCHYRSGVMARGFQKDFLLNRVWLRALLPVWQLIGLPVYMALHHKIGEREDSNEVTAV
jgi:hypothetical protein